MCQSNFGGWKRSCPVAIVLELDWKQWSWNELLNFGTLVLKGIEIWPEMSTKWMFARKFAMWLILTQIELYWPWKEMVLKEAIVYTFCNNFANNRSTGLKFWHNVGTYKLTSVVSFSVLPPLLWKLPCFLCVFNTPPDLLIQWTCRDTISLEIWNLMVDTCLGLIWTKLGQRW